MSNKPSRMTRNSPNNDNALIHYLVSSECMQTHYIVHDKIYARNPNMACEMISDLSGGTKMPIDVNRV